MKTIKVVWVIFLVAIAALFWRGSALSADALDFVVIQPGQPGSAEDAQPVMDALAAYIHQKEGLDRPVKGRYYNELDPALDFLHNRPPAWGIVSLGFYSEAADTFQMTAIAATRPGGHAKDIWRLVVSKEKSGGWKTLKGKVLGNMLFERDAAACLLFDIPADRLPFTLEGTFQPLRSLRKVARGDADGAVLDRTQYEAVKALPLAKDITVVHTSRELPASPVVWFGDPDARARDLAAILLGMKEDGDAQTLLKLLQTDGFGPADPDLPQYRLDRKGAACFQ
ncbi:MAG: phosphate/phosphite/phosphonate ABC transporter substrate-binding protein [Deltaproteobacteria bacterium]|nr:phosphate/phosphite/phosphonate ABC transporter substrate-binding protein [Deltaproteobacteria bacterium]